MTIYLRNAKNENLADIEVSKDDVHAVVPIMAYSVFLLENVKDFADIVVAFDAIGELRGWYHEQFAHTGRIPTRTTPFPTTAQTSAAIIATFLKPLADKYNLDIVTD